MFYISLIKKLISIVQAYAYKAQGLSFKLDSSFPKELPSNIAFTPYSAIRWHDTRQLLLSVNVNSSFFNYFIFLEWWSVCFVRRILEQILDERQNYVLL